MDTNLGGLPLSAAQATPSEVYPKVSLSTSSGSSLPIRAPPTVDSDFEFSLSTNGQDNYNSGSYSSDDASETGLESEEFLSGEDGFETASERPFVADPDDEILEESNFVDEYAVSRPFVTDPYGEISGRTGSVEEFVVSRPFVANRGEEETLVTPSMEEEGEYESFGESEVVDIGVSVLRKSGIPIAILSRDSDDDSEIAEEDEDDGSMGTVRVPGIDNSADKAVKVKVFKVEEEKEEECFSVKDNFNDSFSDEFIEDKGIHDGEEAKGKCFVASKENFLRENKELSDDAVSSVDEIQGLENTEQQESELKKDPLINETLSTIVKDFGANIDGREDVETGKVFKLMGEEVLEFSGDSLLKSDLTSCVSDEAVESKMHDMEIDSAEFVKNIEFEGEIAMDYRFSTNEDFDAGEREIHGQGSNNEKLEGKDEQEIDSAQEGKCHGNVTEDGLQSKSITIDAEIEAEMEVEASLDNSRKGSFSEDDSKSSIFGISEATRVIMDNLDASSSQSSSNYSQRIDGPINGDSDEEVDTDGENEGEELFDSSMLAALLKAASVASSSGGNSTVTSFAQSNRPSFSTGSELKRVESDESLSEEEKKKLEKLQLLRVKFLCLVQRLGLSSEESIAAQVLYRLVLAAGRPSSQIFNIESANQTAKQLQDDANDLNFSLNILVLGKTGVGKSETINSIFGEKKTKTDAFEPATTSVKDIIGTIDGIKVRIFDTPGLRSSLTEQAFNRKILLSVRKFTRKCSPDIVFYVDRLDTQTRDLNDLPLLKSITSLLGSSIWSNAIMILTHAGSSPPDGSGGSPLSYDLFVAQRSRVIQQLISHTVGDLHMTSPSLMCPVSLVENNPSGRKSEDGQILLPNGESWRPQLLLLCYSMKILSEANAVAKKQDVFDHQKLFGFRARPPPLPYLLSSLLQPSVHPRLPSEQGGDSIDSDSELGDLFDSYGEDEDEDEYDQLPPFKPLKKSQIAKLSKEQRKAYFEEYDYRVRLLQEKQWREEMRRLRKLKKGKDGLDDHGFADEDANGETGSQSTVAVPLPDMAVPPSFDGDSPTYLYRFLEPTSQFIARPVLDTHGWDHDCGYDGVSLESSLAVPGSLPVSIAVQITKDKKDFDIHLDSLIAMKHGKNGSTMAGLDIQAVGKQLAYALKGETKMKSSKKNRTACGVSVTFLGKSVATGAKLEDQIKIGKRIVLAGSTGAIRSLGNTAYGANIEVRVSDKDFPVGPALTTVSLSLMRWRTELMWGGNLQSQFSVGRSSKMVVRAGLNSKLSGQVSVRTSSSEQLQIALLGILPIANAIFWKFFPQSSESPYLVG